MNELRELIDLITENADWGMRVGEFIPREGGTYEVEVACPDAGRKLTTKLEVTVPTVEKVGLPAKADVLREISAITGGKSGGTGDLSSLLSQISILPEPKLQEQRSRLWSDPWWCGTLVLLLMAYWVGRKLIGLA